VRPEMPFLAAGVVSVIGGAIREKKWPDNTARAALGTIVLVVAASATTGTKVAPLVNAVGLLLLLTSIMAAVRAAQTKRK
jgi:hypothetical protein